MSESNPQEPQTAPRGLYVMPSPPPGHRHGFWSIVPWVLVLVLVGLCLVSLFVNVVSSSLLLGGGGAASTAEKINEKYVSGPALYRASSKIAVVSVSSVILGDEESGPSSWIIRQLKHAKDDPKVHAIILSVDSPGGGVTSADVVYKKILDFRASGKPVVVMFGDIAASGAYYISAPADKIIAHPTSIVGSIGVIIESFNAAGLLQKIGVESVVYKSAPFKDILSPWRAATEPEKAMLQGITDQMFDRFKSIVAKGRKMSPEEVDAIATGAIFTAEEAKDKKLIDSVGYFEDAVAAAKGIAGVAGATVVKYEKPPSLADYLLGSRKSPGGELEERLNSALEIHKPGFYYLWPGP